MPFSFLGMDKEARELVRKKGGGKGQGSVKIEQWGEES
jgi:hypothetical protein